MTTDISASSYTQQAATGDTLTYTTVAATTVSGTVSKTSMTADTPAAAASSADSVKISLTAQIKLLKQQGQDAKQIAANVGTTQKIVEQYLGESTTAALTQQLLSAGTTA